MPPSSTCHLFFTGRDDPRSCIIIGEGVKGPIYVCFETTERSLTANARTMVYKNNREFCAKLDWSPGNHLGGATIGSRSMPMSQLVQATSNSARAFVSADGRSFEWRRSRENPSSYTYRLFAAPNTQVAFFERVQRSTAVGPSHGDLHYSFAFAHEDLLLIEALVALCINRWIDLHGM